METIKGFKRFIDEIERLRKDYINVTLIVYETRNLYTTGYHIKAYNGKPDDAILTSTNIKLKTRQNLAGVMRAIQNAGYHLESPSYNNEQNIIGVFTQ